MFTGAGNHLENWKKRTDVAKALITIIGSERISFNCGDCNLNCKNKIDRANATKETKSPYQAKAKQEKTEATTIIFCVWVFIFS